MHARTAALAALAAIAGLELALATSCTFDVSGEIGRDAGDPTAPDASQLDLPCLDSSQYSDRPGSSSRYFRVDVDKTYDEAYADCAADGAHLVVIDDADENQFLKDLITDNTWIGLDDLTTEGAFRWADGAPLTLDEFLPNQPDDFNNNEDCGEMRGPADGNHGRWNDAPCAVEQSFVCECTPTVSVPPVPSCMSDPDYDNLSFAGRRYFRGDSNTWAGGRTVCAQDGADLITVGDATEDQFVRDQLVAGGNIPIWLGYSDQRVEGTFEWANGAPVGYEGFNNSQPDDDQQSEDQDCVQMPETTQEWHDDACTETLAFLCECDPSGR